MDGWDQLAIMALTVTILIVLFFIYAGVKLIRKNRAEDKALSAKEQKEQKPVSVLTNAVIIVGLLLLLVLAVSVLFRSCFGA